MTPAPKDCPCCSVPLVLRTNPRGGAFFGCSNFGSLGCRVYWTNKHGWRGLPEVVARASSLRSSVVSIRAKQKAILVTRGLDEKEAIEMIDTFGILEVERLLKTG